METIYEGYITNTSKAKGFFSMTKKGLLHMLKGEDFTGVTIKIKNEELQLNNTANG